MPIFTRTIGIDYSVAETPTASLKGLRVYMADGDRLPLEVPPRRARAWTRKGIAEWLVERLAEDVPTLVGIRTVMSRDSFLAAFREVKAAMMAPSHFGCATPLAEDPREFSSYTSECSQRE